MTDITSAIRNLAAAPPGEPPVESAGEPAGEVISVVEAAIRAGGTIVLRLETPNWPELQVDQPGDLLVELGGVRDYSIVSDQPEDRLLTVELEGPLCWDYRTRSSIMGNAPLPDPHRFFVEFSGLLSDMGSPKSPISYLNWRGSFAGWREIVLARAFLLLTAPLEIAAAATELLDYQAAEYMLLNDISPVDGDKVFAVRFGRSWVVADSAHRLK